MPDHILSPKNTRVVQELFAEGTDPNPLDVLRQRIKEEVNKLLGYGESSISVHLMQPPLDADPDSVALDITIAASNKQKHREFAADWLDALEAVVRDLDIYPRLLEMGGVTLFLPVGEGHFRPLKD